MARLIDADALIESMTKFSNAIGEWQSKTICWFNPDMDPAEIRRVIPDRWKYES